MKKYIDGRYIELTPEEIAEISNAITEEATRSMTLDEVVRLVVTNALNGIEADDETSLRMTEFYPTWEAGKEYPADYKVQRNGVLYRCLTAHTSQAGWIPETSPSLWTKVLIPDTNVVPDWEQPNSTNAYHVGDKVKHDGAVWQSDVDGNVWMPGVYGWAKIE